MRPIRGPTAPAIPRQRGAGNWLAHGERLRRARPNAEARTQLTLAHDAFAELRAPLDGTCGQAHLSVRDHLDVVFLERLSAPGAPQADSRVGGRFGAFATGAGLVLLAHAPDEVREEYLSAPPRRYTSNTVTSPARLRSLLADVRREGYASSDRMVGPDVACVGAPIHGAGGSVVAALSIAFRAGSQSPQTLAPAVRAAARRVSRALRE